MVVMLGEELVGCLEPNLEAKSEAQRPIQQNIGC